MRAEGAIGGCKTTAADGDQQIGCQPASQLRDLRSLDPVQGSTGREENPGWNIWDT